MWTSPNGQVEVAVKQLKEGTSEADRVKFLKEAAIMGQFQHPNVIKLHGVVTMADPVCLQQLLTPQDREHYNIFTESSLEVQSEVTYPNLPLMIFIHICCALNGKYPALYTNSIV